MTLGHVRVDLDGASARFRALLASNAFDVLQRALMGARYDRQAGASVAPLPLVQDILDRLRKADFDVTCTDEVLGALDKRRDEDWLERHNVEERVESIGEEMHARTGHTYYPFQRTGILWLALRHGGLLADDMGLGKLAPVSEPVLTPGGWLPIGSVRVGDEVIGSSGRPTKVTGVFPQGVKEIYRVTLSNGATTRCGLEHLWQVRSTRGGYRTWSVRTLAEIIAYTELTNVPGYHIDLEIPVLTGLDVDPRELETRPIRSIERAGEEESVCIRVAAKDHLYVTNDFIVTHNTIQAITSLPANAPALVVAPVNAKGVWRDEVRKWRPQLRVSVLEGRESFRWPRPGELVSTNYDVLPKVCLPPCDGLLPAERCRGCGAPDFDFVYDTRPGADPLASLLQTARSAPRSHRPDCDGWRSRRPCPGCAPFLKKAAEGTVLIFDEMHRIKNKKAQRTIRAAALARAVRRGTGRTWGLTGTPLENTPPELWAILQILGCAEEAFGSFDHFADLLGGQLVSFDRKNPERRSYVWSKAPSAKVKEHLQRVMLRRLRSDVLPELPPKRRQIVQVDITPKAIREIERALEALGHDAESVARLIEEGGETEFQRMASVRKALATAKIPAMLVEVENAEEAGEPLIVFSAHRGPIDQLEKRPGWRVITGDTPSDARREIEALFQAGKLCGVGCTIRAGGEGITLTRGNRVLFVDLDWKPTANDQAEDRAMRIGQTRGVLVLILMADHDLDRRVIEVIERKRRMIEGTVDAARVVADAPLTELEDRELAELVRRTKNAEGTPRRAGEAEEAIVDALHAGAFASTSEEQLASTLGQKAKVGGLTEAEWSLARFLVDRAERSVALALPSALDAEGGAE